MTRSKRRKHQTRGEMISTFAFAVSGLFFIGEAHLYRAEGAIFHAVLIGFCGVLCVAGALRFHLHNLWDWLGRNRR